MNYILEYIFILKIFNQSIYIWLFNDKKYILRLNEDIEFLRCLIMNDLTKYIYIYLFVCVCCLCVYN